MSDMEIVLTRGMSLQPASTWDEQTLAEYAKSLEARFDGQSEKTIRIRDERFMTPIVVIADGTEHCGWIKGWDAASLHLLTESHEMLYLSKASISGMRRPEQGRMEHLLHHPAAKATELEYKIRQPLTKMEQFAARCFAYFDAHPQATEYIEEWEVTEP